MEMKGGGNTMKESGKEKIETEIDVKKEGERGDKLGRGDRKRVGESRRRWEDI
jgi:hypothetical protein